MCIDSLMVPISWTSTRAVWLAYPIQFDSMNSLPFDQDHSGIHDAICHCASLQRIAWVCRACTCPRISGRDTYAGSCRLRLKANQTEIFPSDAMDAQSVCHQRLGSWCFLWKQREKWRRRFKSKVVIEWTDKWCCRSNTFPIIKNLAKDSYVSPIAIEPQQSLCSFWLIQCHQERGTRSRMAIPLRSTLQHSQRWFLCIKIII